MRMRNPRRLLSPWAHRVYLLGLAASSCALVLMLALIVVYLQVSVASESIPEGQENHPNRLAEIHTG